MKTPYKMYHPLEEIRAADTHGQGWKNETIEETIALCSERDIEPVFRARLPKDGRILEAGCGLGTWVFYLRRLGYDVTGIELSDEALRIARAYGPDAPIEKQDLLHMDFQDGTFDAVISLGLLEHFEEGPGRAFQEIRRILKDNGLLFVTVPVQNVTRRLLANPLKAWKRRMRQRHGIAYGFEEYRYTTGEFSQLLRDAGFDIVGFGPDEFRPPKCIGFYVDYPFFHHKEHKWELNRIGSLVRRTANFLSPWSTAGGAYWICRKR